MNEGFVQVKENSLKLGRFFGKFDLFGLGKLDVFADSDGLN